MLRSIGDVARLTGVTARTLRHYDDIGLLRPATSSANGYRWYGREELLRLQRILLLRELQLPLADIQSILSGDSEEVAFLRTHRGNLQAERSRLELVIGTVDRTIQELEGTRSLDDEEFFVGLDRRTSALRADMVARFGPAVDQHFVNAGATMESWTRADHERAAERGRDLFRRLAAARAAGVRPDQDAALDLMIEHHNGVRALWPVEPAAYFALAEAVLDSPQQRTMIADVDPELPGWLAEAIRAYARIRLDYQSG